MTEMNITISTEPSPAECVGDEEVTVLSWNFLDSTGSVRYRGPEQLSAIVEMFNSLLKLEYLEAWKEQMDSYAAESTSVE